MLEKKTVTNIALVAFVVLSTLTLYWQTIEKLMATWSNSNTYGHGFLILPIVLWLVYKKRSHLNEIEVSTSALAVFFVGLTSFTWFVSVLTYVNVVEQFIMYLIPIMLVWALFGKKILCALKFPLFFLFFSIPVGDFLVPYLQFITADISVYMLGLLDIPVYRDGMFIEIPNGQFLVAEACSGIRFLISTFTIGILFSYLNFTQHYKKIIFILLCLIVPILGNGLRAFLMILIGHLSDMQAATGFDHLVYGWVFFSIIIAILFVIGHYMADPLEEPIPENNNSSQKLPSGKFIVITFLCMLIGPLANMQYETYINNIESINVSAAKSEINVETKQIVTNKSWQPVFPQADSLIYKKVKQGDSLIDLYVADYLYETSSKELISWENELFDLDVWALKSMDNATITTNYGMVIPYKIITIVDVSGKQRELRIIYKVGDYLSANKIETKLLQLLHKLSMSDLGGKAYVISAQVTKTSTKDLNQLITTNTLFDSALFIESK